MDRFAIEQICVEMSGRKGSSETPTLFWSDDKLGLHIYKGDSLILMEEIVKEHPNGVFDLIFADPPYFLSNGGITCQAGRMVRVDKGDWDRLASVDQMHEFNRMWLTLCQRILKADGTIFVSGTSHVIHSIGFAMQQLEYKILNDITWLKPNPPPNLSCRYFTHASETVLWGAKNKKSRHKYNYDLMREQAGGKQMKSVWRDIRWDDQKSQAVVEILPPAVQEKRFGKHPTQKPEMLLERLIAAATDEGDIVYDPFLGGGTTAVAAKRLKRRFVGCDLDPQYLKVAVKRLSLAQ